MLSSPPRPSSRPRPPALSLAPSNLSNTSSTKEVHRSKEKEDFDELSYYSYTPELPIASSPTRPAFHSTPLHPPLQYSFDDSQHRYWDYVSLEREYKFLVNQYIALRNNSFASPSAPTRRSPSNQPASSNKHNGTQTSRRTKPAKAKSEDEHASNSTRENGHVRSRSSSRTPPPTRPPASFFENSSHLIYSDDDDDACVSTQNDGSEKLLSPSVSLSKRTNSSRSSSQTRTHSPWNQKKTSSRSSSPTRILAENKYNRERSEHTPANEANISQRAKRVLLSEGSEQSPASSQPANPYLLAFVQLSVMISVRTGLQNLDLIILAIATAVVWKWLGSGRA